MGRIVILLPLVLACVGDSYDNVVNHPGHLKAFGDPLAGQRIPVAKVSAYPTPIDFVENFVLPNRPLLFKGVFKTSPAYSLWEDDYFRTIHEPKGNIVNVETKKKEDRNQKVIEKSFKSFVGIYRDEPVYMVSPVPEYLERDVPVASCLQCPAIIRLFRQNVMWMSSGGTKSVVHIDEFENFNCLVRGVKELILVDRKKYPKEVPLDKAGETFSSLDVDAVDYRKYPSMADVVEFHFANMTEGDCLYIPYKWIHQVRSYGRNIAVNLWWDHHGTKALNLARCKEVNSGRRVTFEDVDWGHFVEDESFRPQMTSMAEDGAVSYERLKSIYFEDGFSGKSIFDGLPPSNRLLGEEQLVSIFSKLDSNGDGQVSLTELNLLSRTQWKEVEKMEETLSLWIEGIVTKNGSENEEL